MEKDSDNIQVIVRVRPFSDREKEKEKSCIFIEPKNQKALSITEQNQKTSYTFDWVGPESTSQQQVFEKVGKSLVERCLEGYNCCILAYGQTGAGKTYTMEGRGLNSDDTTHRGLEPRIFDYLFELMERDKQDNQEATWCVQCTHLEIYNEIIMDLLAPDNKGLSLRDFHDEPVIEGLTKQIVEDSATSIGLLQLGSANRHTGATDMNDKSSRSHSLFTLHIERKTPENNGVNVRKSKFHFVDLAGSERQKDTNSIGGRLKEASNINQSLTVLGLVIRAHVDAAKKGQKGWTRYRESKLTHILKDSIGGNSKTCLIANISPISSSASQTASTLKFASTAKQIRNKASINQDFSGSVEDLKNVHQIHVEKLNMEIKELKQCVIEEENRYRELELKFEELTETGKISEGSSAQRIKELLENLEKVQAENLNMKNLQKNLEEVKRDNLSLKKQKEECENQIRGLVKKYDSLDMLLKQSSETKEKQEKIEYIKLKSDYDAKDLEFKILKDNLRKSEEKVHSLIENEQRLNEKVMGYEKENKAQSLEHIKLKNDYDAKDLEFKILKDSLRKSEEKVHSLIENEQRLNDKVMGYEKENKELLQARKTNEATLKSKKEKSLLSQNEELNIKFIELQKVCKERDDSVLELEKNVTRLEEKLFRSEENVRSLTETNKQLEEENENILKSLESEETSSSMENEDDIVSKNQALGECCKKIDELFKSVLAVEDLGDGDVEKEEEFNVEDSIHRLSELEESFIEKDKVVDLQQKVPRPRNNNNNNNAKSSRPKLQVIMDYDNRPKKSHEELEEIRVKRERTEINNLKLRMSKEEGKKVNVKETLVGIFEESRRVCREYQQEVEELKRKLKMRSEESLKKKVDLKMECLEKQLEMKKKEAKECKEKMVQLQKKLDCFLESENGLSKRAVILEEEMMKKEEEIKQLTISLEKANESLKKVGNEKRKNQRKKRKEEVEKYESINMENVRLRDFIGDVGADYLNSDLNRKMDTMMQIFSEIREMHDTTKAKFESQQRSENRDCSQETSLMSLNRSLKIINTDDSQEQGKAGNYNKRMFEEVILSKGNGNKNRKTADEYDSDDSSLKENTLMIDSEDEEEGARKKSRKKLKKY